MTEDSGTKVSPENSTVNTDSQPRQRRKRKWDQPAESLVSSGIAPLGNAGSLVGISLPGLANVSSALYTNPIVATSPPVFQVSSIQQNTATQISKSNQPKIQDELIIAREISINDAESSIRHKLTKRQTQEEIQKCTGAVVITRGKYRPPNAPPDGEKPLYLHISAGAHLKDTAERILAVDRAASMVEEMIKQGQNLQPASSTFQMPVGNGVTALSTCVFLGFDTDPMMNIAARIRGPNDQYINHIMNETGATVALRGRGSTFENPNGGEVQQPLHLFLSAGNPKSLEDAKRLAENLLDTISSECGVSRISSSKVYSAVPPPQHLVQCSGNDHKVNTSSAAALTISAMSSTPSAPASGVTVSEVNPVLSQGTLQSAAIVNCGQPQTSSVGYPQPTVMGGASYSGYGGIYPQATPLQQVALALRYSSSPIASNIAPSASVVRTDPMSSTSSIAQKEKQPTQKRKFQELPVSSKGSAMLHQGLALLKPGEQPPADSTVRNVSTMPAPKKVVRPSSDGMLPPPPPRTMPPPAPKFTSSTPAMPPPPPPPKFSSSASTEHNKNHALIKTKSDSVPDTLVKLMEYGEEDDDPNETS